MSLLVGMGNPGLCNAITSLAVTGVNGALDATITIPAVAAGDLLIYFGTAYHTVTSTVSFGSVSGFTEIGSSAEPDDFVVAAAYKIATGSESGSSITNPFSNIQTYSHYVIAAKANRPILQATPASFATAAVLNANPTSQVVTSSGGTRPLIVVASFFTSSSGGVDPRTFTPTEDAESSAAAQYHYVKYKTYLSSFANVTVDMDNEGGYNSLASCYIQVA